MTLTRGFFDLATITGTVVLTWAILALALHALERVEAALRRFGDRRRWERARRRKEEQ